jgi:hypothetical protein
MSKIEVNQVDPQSGTTLTLGTSGDTISIPAGVTLANSGTATGFASIAWQSTIVTTSTLTAVAGNGYWIDTTSNACTVTLPGSASVGDQIIFVDYARNWGTNAITLDQNGLNYQGGTDNPVYDTNGQTVNIVYSGATNGWIPISDDDVANEGNIPTYSVDFLVVAGGGSGGVLAGGGGGAGGYRTSTQTVTAGTAITVTVGDGGASVSGSTVDGNAGSDSSISGSGLTTITSAGGGAGGYYLTTTAGSGGSGGGGGGKSGGSTGGTGNTPSTTPSQGNNGGTGNYDAVGQRCGAGGGGAGAVGGNGTNSSPYICGNGGAGTASSITGSSVTRAGGGGGSGNDAATTAGSGGAGGGGNGVFAPNNGSAGTANTGGGGGGGSDGTSSSGAGGKGVVILSMPDASYSGTTTGSPTVATGVSGKTILTYTGSGSYTA